MHTVIIVPDGAGVRNFLCSTFIELALDHGPVTVWHALPSEAIAPHRERFGTAVTWEVLPRYREGLLARLLRQSKIFAQLAWQRDRDGSGVMLKFLRRPRRLKPRLLWLASRAVGRVFGSAHGAALLHRRHARWAVRRSALAGWCQALRAMAPDVVFCTHQRASLAVPPMLAARACGVPAVTFVYSWDNLPKGRMAVYADHVLLWSAYMATELQTYEPERDPATIWVVGTPQFESHHDPTIGTTRQAFLDTLGLDPARPVICYSGCDLTSAPHDPHYLADLARALRDWPPDQRPQVLFRPSPADPSGRYQPALDAFPEIVVSKPLWSRPRGDAWATIVPTREDMALLTNVVRHCDLVVNVGSTMGMDFAIVDKPAIFIAYDPSGETAGTSLDDSYRLPHFRSVKVLDPVYWARSADELASLVHHALDQPGDKSAARRAWVEQQAMVPLEKASQRTIAALAKIASISGKQSGGEP